MSIATSCRICCLDDDIRRAIDTDLSAGLKPSVVARKYAKQINRTRADSAVRFHKNMGHVGKEPSDKQQPAPGSLPAIKEERHRKSVEDRIDEMYELALDGCRLAKAGEQPNIRGLAACIAQGIAATALMGKPSDSDDKATSGLAEMREAMRRGLATAPTRK